MYHIAIISSSVRAGRKSNRVASFFLKYITENNLASAEILDLLEYNFPIMEERAMNLANPSDQVKDFVAKVLKADAVIIVTPEYNGSFPASLKNAIDLLVKEWHHKPIGLAAASNGNFGGMNAIAILQNVFLRIKAVPVPATFPVPVVETTFDENGVPSDKEHTEKRAASFIKELLWFAEAFSKMK